MTPMELRNEALGEKVARALEKRNMDAWYVPTRKKALEKVLELLPEGCSVSWGGSATLDEVGVLAAVRQGPYKVLDRAAAGSPEEYQEIQHQALSCDYFLGSTNAMTEDGVLVNIDGNANRLAAYCYGPAHVLLVVGINKITKNLDEAMLRARNLAAPVNAQRFDLDIPCRKVGTCMNCMVEDTICCQFLTTRYSRVKGRFKVVLVGESLGF